MTKIPASVAMVKVMEAWGIKRIFGYPAGSVNSLMSALRREHNQIQYIQVRHEQVGALAAAAHAKITGKIGVAFGSAGPGAINMLNGLYDAKMDHVPVLAIVGQTNSDNLNYRHFQTMPEQPAFNDVACYDRIIINPESLPHVTDQAIRAAYHHHGVAVIIVPNNWGFVSVPPLYTSHDQIIAPQTETTLPDQITTQFLQMIQRAQDPVFHVGSGIGPAGSLLSKLARKLQIPIVIDGPAKSLISGTVADLGTSNRDVSKPANEILAMADLVIAITPDYALSPRYYRHHPSRLIQIESNPQRLGSYRQTSLSIQADPSCLLQSVLKHSQPMKHQPFYQASLADIRNWRHYLKAQMLQVTDPITPAQVYYQINRIANRNALFSVDIGDNLINSLKFLHLGHDNQLIFSRQFATMGCSLPGAIAAQLDNPKRQVFSIAGDGAFSMVMQDLITLRKYRLPVINIVTSNGTTNYIREKQADLSIKDFGNQLMNQDFAMIAHAMGIRAVNVTRARDLPRAFNLAQKITHRGSPFLINVQITKRRSLPVENLRLDRDSLTETYYEHQGLNSHLRKIFDHFRGRSLRSLVDFIKRES